MNISRRTLCCAVAAAFTFGTVFGCKSRYDAPGGAATGDNAAPKSKSDATPEKKKEAPASARKTPEPPEHAIAKSDAYKNETISYTVKLDTTKGDIIIDVYENLAPLAAKRFRTLVEDGFYNDAAFFRVIKGFVAQAGIAGDPEINAKWRSERMPDDPVLQSNIEGTVSFASAGPNSRTTQFFINYSDNRNLDGMGFAPFGKVRDMKPAFDLYHEYTRGNTPNQALVQRQGNAYLKKEFPKLDYIKKATIVPTK